MDVNQFRKTRKEIRHTGGIEMSREKLLDKKYDEVLALLAEIKLKASLSRYFVHDLEEEINRLTFLAVKLRQIVEYTKGGNQI